MPRRKNKIRAKNKIDWQPASLPEQVLTPEQTDKWLIEFRKLIGIEDPYADTTREVEFFYMKRKFLKEDF